MKRLVFLFDAPILKNDVRKFSLDELLEIGCDVTLCDITPYTSPEVNDSITAERFSDERFKYMVLDKLSDIESLIRDNRDAFFFPMFDNYYETRRIFPLFTKYDITFGHVNNAMTDMVLDAAVENAEDYAAYHTFDHYKKAFYHRVGRRLRHDKPAEFQVFGGTAGEDTHFANAQCREGYTKRIHLWTYNYEAFNRVKPFENDGRPYAMVIDQYSPFHPDLTVKRGVHIDPDLYYGELCSVFDYVREHLGLDIIVSAHPRADYRGREHYYRDCRIMYGMTAELARGAAMIFSNSSGANAYAVFENTPITLINMSATQGYAHSSNLCDAYAKLLGCNVIREKEDIEKTDYYFINEKAYHDFWKLYVMSADEKNDKNFWQNVIDLIK